MQAKQIADKRLVLTKMKKNYPETVVAESYLRLEVELTNMSSFKFTIKDDGRKTETEVRLSRNDQFVVSELGLFLKAVKDDGHAITPLQTYPNPAVFTDVNNGFQHEHLYAIYNGHMSVKSGSRTWIERLDTQRFLHVPAMAQGTVMAHDDQNGTAFSIADSPYQDGMSNDDVNGFIKFPGNSNHEIVLHLPEYSGIQIQNTNTGMKNYLVLILKGVIAHNVLGR